MRRYAILVVCAVALAVVLVGCKGASVKNDPMDVAKAYGANIREGKIDRAKALCTFENDKAEAEWEKQVKDYMDRKSKGGFPWWPDPFKAQKVPGPGTGEWAFVEVQWRYRAGLGWMMGEHFTYRMRTVEGKWKLVIDEQTTKSGIPWVPEHV